MDRGTAGTGAIEVRTARPDDVPALLGLLDEIVRAGGTTAIEEPIDEGAFRDWFVDGPDCIVLFVAVGAGDAPLGFQSLARRADLPPGCVDIATFARRRPKVRGVGTALFARTQRFARERGIRSINATIRADNAGGLAFYGRMGFVERAVERAVPLLDGTPVDRVSKRYAVEPPSHPMPTDGLARP